MAERRMFTRKITESDSFLDMPCSTQMLYFHLSMNADDDGFVNNPKKIQRMCGASDDDFKLLVAKSFVLLFDSGIIVIKHWKMHNYIRSDRYKPSDYTEEKSMLTTKSNKAYSLIKDEVDAVGIPMVDVGKVSIGKDSINIKESNTNVLPKKKTSNVFTPPTVEEVTQYCKERNNNVDAEMFVDFYSAKGWMIGKNKMKSWKHAVHTWERNKQKDSNTVYQQNKKRQSFDQREYDMDDLESKLLNSRNRKMERSNHG